MKTNYRKMVFVALFTGFLVAACSKDSVAPVAPETRPIKIERLEGVNNTRETLTEEASSRLDIQTVKVSESVVNGAKQKVVPYAAVVYDALGNSWVYINSGPLTFERKAITILDIKGDQAILKEGPPAGTPVVTVGAAELYGAEFEFKEE